MRNFKRVALFLFCLVLIGLTAPAQAPKKQLKAVPPGISWKQSVDTWTMPSAVTSGTGDFTQIQSGSSFGLYPKLTTEGVLLEHVLQTGAEFAELNRRIEALEREVRALKRRAR